MVRKGLIGLVVLVIILPFTTATDWYVRPIGGSYGNEDGSDYDNAFDGIENVVWGAGGVDSGDTLYICGTHIHTYDASFPSSQPPILNLVSGSPGNPTIIRGDCPGDSGIVWGAAYPAYRPWTFEGNDTYSTNTNSGNHPRGNVFEDPSGSTATLLNPQTSIQECKDNPGSFYTNKTIMYVHRNDGADPTGTVAVGRIGYRFNARGSSYINFINLTFINWYASFGFKNGEHHLTWIGCEFKWHEGAAIEFRANNNIHDMVITGCTASYGRDGFYAVDGPAGTGLYNFEWTNNTVHHMGYPTNWYSDGDRHCIATQDAHNGVISGNEVYACQSGLVFYANNADQIITNITVKNNYIHDVEPGTHGISFRGDGVNAGENKGNKIYNNIVTGCEMGIYVKYGYNIDVFNNVIYDCNWGIDAAGTQGQPDSPKVTFKNNIVLNSRTYHFRVTSANPEGHYLVNADYNLYYPISGKQFYIGDNWGKAGQSIIETDFSGWQAISKAGCTFDPHSIVADPLFVDPANGDFHLQAGSPAIDMGIDVGLAHDFEGNPIPIGAGPDIGAFEYDSGVVNCSVEGDLNNDCIVDINDLVIITSDFGKTSGFDLRADIDSNNIIDIFDIVFVASRFS